MQFKKFKKLHSINNDVVIPALEKCMQEPTADKILIRKEIEKVYSCGSIIYTIRCNQCGQDHFKGFSRCKSKFCALCNQTKARMWVARLFQFCKDWLSAGKYIVFLNFTIRDRDNLEEGLNVLEKAWHEMTSENVKFRKVFKSKFLGGVRSLEIKLGEKSNLWHPHLHCLALKDKPSKDTYFLHYAWPLAVHAAGGDIDERNLKILPFSPYDKSNVVDRESFNLELVKSIAEVVKYIVKVDYASLPPKRLAELVPAVKGKRQINLWGVLYNLKQVVDGDMETMSERELKEFVCQVCGCTSGTMNSLARYIWENDYIIDLAQTPIEKLPDEKFVESIKRKNGKLPPLPPPKPVNPTQIQFNFDGLIEY